MRAFLTLTFGAPAALVLIALALLGMSVMVSAAEPYVGMNALATLGAGWRITDWLGADMRERMA